MTQKNYEFVLPEEYVKNRSSQFLISNPFYENISVNLFW